MAHRKLAAGNWKMNGLADDLKEVEALLEAHPVPGCDILICPPATLLSRMADLVAGRPLSLGGQDCHAASSGAHTGDLSAAMLADAGARCVIVGHSERRADHGESDADVAAKARAALDAGLDPIVCVGETLEEREAGRTLEVVEGQLEGSLPQGDAPPDRLTVAYEPVWAIGTGRVPTTDQIAEVHGALRDLLKRRFGEAGQEIRILYGGSVKPGNAAEIFAVANVDGALVGGASLKADDFGGIIAALEAA